MNVGELVKELEKFDKKLKIVITVDFDTYVECVDFDRVDAVSVRCEDKIVIIECMGY